MSKMTEDNKLIKAFECCINLRDCKNCPFCEEGMKTCKDGEVDEEQVLNFINRLKAENKALTTELEQKTEMMANLGVKLISCEDENERLKIDLQSMRSAANSLKMHLKKYQDIESTIAEKIREIFFRYSHLHSCASKARVDEITNHCEGAKIEMQSVWDVLSLGKHDLVNYEEMNRLQDNIEVIAKERLLAELKKDFRVLINEMASETFTKLDHSSLCETETYEGR